MSLLEKIQQHIVDDADCWRWQLGCCNGHPAMRHEGKTKLVRRLLWADAKGPIPKGAIVRKTCETPDCVNPEHIELTSYKKVAKQCGALGLMSGPLRTAKIAATKQRTHGKITMETANMIRSSPESGAALARKTGITQAKISKIRRNEAWSAPSPWAGLGAM